MAESQSRRPMFALSIVLCVGAAVAMIWMRLGVYRDAVLPIGYGVPLVLAAWMRNRRLLWTMVVVFAATTLLKFIYLLPLDEPLSKSRDHLEAIAVLLDLLLVGLIVDMLVVSHLKVERHEAEGDRRRRAAEEASARKSRFLAAVSHDIRTPANAISLLAELIQRTAAEPGELAEIPELARELHKSAMGLVQLVSDVLDLTRLDAGFIELKETEFELGPWLAEECRKLEPLAAAKKLAFDCRAPQPPMIVRCDRLKLSRIMQNLVANAIKFTEKGQVHVAAVRDPGGLRLTVCDTGVGIPREHQEKIFDEFFQLKNPGRDSAQGTGLGLSISRRLGEAMGGRLTVASEPGKGSTFSLTLPSSAIIR